MERHLKLGVLEQWKRDYWVVHDFDSDAVVGRLRLIASALEEEGTELRRVAEVP
jgi:hypothetical protein